MLPETRRTTFINAMTLSANSAFQKLLWTISHCVMNNQIHRQIALHSITRDNFCNCRRYAIISLWTHSNTLASCVIEQLTFYGDIYTAVQKFEVSRIKKIQNKYLILTETPFSWLKIQYILWNIITNFIYSFLYILKCNLYLWGQSLISSNHCSSLQKSF